MTKHHGWSNHATWQVLLILDNTQDYHNAALDIVREDNTRENKAVLLYAFVADLKHILKEDDESLQKIDLKQIDWSEIIEHYEIKIEEGC